jgi:hypothetical protein
MAHKIWVQILKYFPGYGSGSRFNTKNPDQDLIQSLISNSDSVKIDPKNCKTLEKFLSATENV